MVKNAAPAGDPLAGLRSAFERLGADCTEKLRQLAPVPMEVTFRDIVSGVGDEAIAGYGETALLGAFQMPDQGLPVLIGADAACMDAALEAVFGSDGSERSSHAERVPTRIEMHLARTIFEQVADALRLAVFGDGAAALELKGVETAAKPPATAKGGEPRMLAEFGLSALERQGRMFIILPESALRGSNRTSAKAIAAAPTIADPRWSKRIEHEVQRTQVTLQAVLDERELTLGEVAELRVGQVLPLKATPRSNVKVVCNDQTLFWCELGQSEGMYTLRIKDFPEGEQDLIDAITSR